MNLNDVLRQIAEYAQLDVDELIAYAAEDTEGGRGVGGFDGWSIDADEGKLLYALVRALKPAQSIEIGVRHGASTKHLLAAIDANETGLLDSYDLEANGSYEHTAWTFHQGDALNAEFPPAEFVFEDGAHTLDFSLKIFEKLKQFAHVVVTHDYAMTAAHGDFHVKEAFDTVFPDGVGIVLDGCERGLGIWVNQERLIAECEARAAYDAQQVTPPKTVAKKPTTTAKAKAKR